MVYVISGGPGFGKTTLVNLLAQRGYSTCPELARELLLNRQSADLEVDNDLFFKNFERNVASQRINFVMATSKDTLAFADRGVPDQVAYSCYKKKSPSGFIRKAVSECRYGPFVFLTPPWKEIFVQDEIRTESFKDASELHLHIVQAYKNLGYEIILLPLSGPEERADFILHFLGI